MATILGIASSHDASACVMRDGRLLAAVSQERMTRRKNDGYRVPHEAIAHALEVAGAAPADIDAVATIHAFFPERFFRRESAGKELESRLVRARRRIAGEDERYLNVNDLLKRVGPIEARFRQARFLDWLGLRPDVQVGFFDHHATHASAAAWASGFPRCAVVTIDGVGELNIHHTSGVYAGGAISPRRRLRHARHLAWRVLRGDHGGDGFHRAAPRGQGARPRRAWRSEEALRGVPPCAAHRR